MFEKRLYSLNGEGKKYIRLNVLVQWGGLLAEIAVIYAAALTLDALYSGLSGGFLAFFAIMTATGTMFVRYFCVRGSFRCGFLSAMKTREVLHSRLSLKADAEKEERQKATENAERMEKYCSEYLPQLYYAPLAAVTVTVAACFVCWKAALLLPAAAGRYLIAEIPNEILTRKTRDVLICAAYLCVALGIVVCLLELKNHNAHIYGCLMVIMLTGELLRPLRLLEKSRPAAEEGRKACDAFFTFLEKEEGGEKAR